MTVEPSSAAQPSDMPHLLMMIPFLKTAELQEISKWLEAGVAEMPRLCADVRTANDMLKQDNGNFLILSPAADEVVAAAVQDGLDMEEALSAWRDTSAMILDIVRKNRRRVSIVGFDALRADPVAALAVASVAFTPLTDGTFPIAAPDDVLRLAAQAALRQSRDASRLVGEWQAASPVLTHTPQTDPAGIFATAQAQKDDLDAAQAAATKLSQEAEKLRDTLTKEMEKAAALDARAAEQEKQRTFMERELSENRKERDALLQQLIKSQEALIELKMDGGMARDLVQARHELRLQKETLDAAQEREVSAAKEMQGLRDALAQEAEQNATHVARVRALEKDVSAAHADLVQQQAAVQSAQAKGDQLEAHAQALQTSLDEETKRVQVQVARSRVLEQDLAEIRQEKDNLLRQLMKTHEAMIAMRMAFDADDALKADNVRLQADLARAKTELDAQVKQHKRLDAELSKIRKDEQKQREELARTKATLARIMASSSMRITAPLRRFRALLSRR